MRVQLIGFCTIPLAIGVAIACGIYKYGNTAAHDKKMAPIFADDMHWIYLSVVVFGRLVAMVNIYPMTWKAKIMRMKSGNLRSNMFIYKQVGDKAVDNAIVLEDVGDVGGYNRANRSLHHMVENFGVFVVGLALAGAVAAAPCASAWCP